LCAKLVEFTPDHFERWFNLGVVESKLGPSRLPAAQGAFAIAYSLNPALKDRRPDMTIDAKVYRTALDLSKPLWGEACLAMGRDRAAGVTMGDLERPARRRRRIMSGDVRTHSALDKDDR
jgi:hypothetical protein